MPLKQTPCKVNLGQRQPVVARMLVELSDGILEVAASERPTSRSAQAAPVGATDCRASKGDTQPRASPRPRPIPHSPQSLRYHSCFCELSRLTVPLQRFRIHV